MAGRYTEAQARASRTYDSRMGRINIRMGPDILCQIKAHAEATGESVNRFMIRAAMEAMERDGPPVGL